MRTSAPSFGDVMSSTSSVTSLSSNCSSLQTPCEVSEVYKNEINGFNKILIDNIPHEITGSQEIQEANFLNKNKDSNLFDALK